ncbi:MAG: Stage II sporulation protein E [uncultured Nocardioidaceae bacterium]|uniref:Stage II sporulation protein E n=1 Tax=uncultured Nocardioidaceae bacterium TaxID=253824 RepID=A0A6J4LS89_9ACTN|nr:MAG: Stage II sporulation protein E [uncultured Nocardioidaceae bacterium]
MSQSYLGRIALPGTLLSRPGVRALRWLKRDNRGVLGLLVTWTVVAAVLMNRYPSLFGPTLFMVALFLVDVVLAPRRVPLFVAIALGVLAVETGLELNRSGDLPPWRWVNLGLVVLVAGTVLNVAWRRARLGVAGLTGDAMLGDLQERISRQGRIPALPIGWHLETSTRSAGSTSFAGDFLVAHRAEGGGLLSLVLVDVSGKGVDAGTRALLLSGALGGLIGAVPPDRFMASANEFLLRQSWEEGFATAVLVSVDLATGDYEVRSAGHPPAIQFLAGSGRWHLHEDAEGPALGLVPDYPFQPMRGRLGRDDALLLYTDGLVERPGRDITLGIDRLVGEGERLVRRGFDGSAQGLVEKLGAVNDDCAVVVLQRH